MSKGRNAIITGSTSGIGLGIAESFAAAGINVMLNGFGEANEIEATRAGLADSHGVKVGYHGADMTKPDEIADMVANAGPNESLLRRPPPLSIAHQLARAWLQETA